SKTLTINKGKHRLIWSPADQRTGLTQQKKRGEFDPILREELKKLNPLDPRPKAA
ncbi:hypothetical protein LINPERPRIM_LOCUS44235, partial [Linum perenne]